MLNSMGAISQWIPSLESIGSFLFSTIAILFAFCLIVFIHELGHFLVAKKLGVRVERFAFGFGPEIFGFTKGETRYVFALIPLGGEVRMSGEDMSGEAKDDPRSFFAQPWYRRIQIALAGPVMNYILAFFLFFIVGVVWGFPIRGVLVRGLQPGEPAEIAGLLPGDEIIGFSGQTPVNWSDIIDKIKDNPEKELQFVIQRDGQESVISIIPSLDPLKGTGRIGIQLEPSPNVLASRRGFLVAITQSAKQIYYWTVTPLVYLGQKLIRFEAPEELSGPIGIAKVISVVARSGLRDFISLLAVLSTAIGLFNFLPIPVLDGGHVAESIVIFRPITQLGCAKAC